MDDRLRQETVAPRTAGAPVCHLVVYVGGKTAAERGDDRIRLEFPRTRPTCQMPRIRDATLDDAPAIAAIYNESIEARDSTMQLARIDAETARDWIEAMGTREAVLVMGTGGERIGYGRLKRYSKRGGYRLAAETSIYLRRARTGEGLGTDLQAALIERSRAYDYHHLVAKLWADNERSRALHRKLGYDLVGIQQEIGRVDGEWQDVAIMQKLLRSNTA